MYFDFILLQHLASGPIGSLMNCPNQRSSLQRTIDLSGADLTDANLETANLETANLYGANLTDANLPRANLTGAYLRAANPTRATMPDGWQDIVAAY